MWLIVAWWQRSKVSPLYWVETRLIDTVVDQHYRLVVVWRRKVYPSYRIETKSIDTVVDWHYWLIVAWRRKVSPLHQIKTRLIDTIVETLLVDCCVKEKGVPFISYQDKVNRHSCWSTLQVDCCMKEQGVPFISYHIKTGWLTQLLIDITGWLLHEGARCLLCIK